jgi:hypothetical protein
MTSTTTTPLSRGPVSYTPTFCPRILDPVVRNAWGVALRPAGLGGHFWMAYEGWK